MKRSSSKHREGAVTIVASLAITSAIRSNCRAIVLARSA